MAAIPKLVVRLAWQTSLNSQIQKTGLALVDFWLTV